jgi:hypothetical protein
VANLELGMFDAAALVLEEIAPKDKNRNEVLGNAGSALHGSQEMGHGRRGREPNATTPP